MLRKAPATLPCLIVFAAHFLDRVHSKLVVTPSNVTVSEGSTVTLKCSTDGSYELRWWHTRYNQNSSHVLGEKIFSGRKVVNNTIYSINRTDGKQFDLIIKSATQELAGKYTCEEHETETRRTVEVTVLNSNSTSPGQILTTETNNNSVTIVGEQSTTTNSDLSQPLVVGLSSAVVLVAISFTVLVVAFKKRIFKRLSTQTFPEPDLYNVSHTTSTSSKGRVTDDQKSRKSANSRIAADDFVIYANNDVPDPVYDNQEPFKSYLNSPSKIIGEDGTEYVQVNSARSNDLRMTLPIRSKPTSILNDNSDIYVSIDHTLSPPKVR